MEGRILDANPAAADVTTGIGLDAAFAVEQAAAIAEPFIDAYLVPSNLASTAFLRQGENGMPQWVKPSWKLVTDI